MGLYGLIRSQPQEICTPFGIHLEYSYAAMANPKIQCRLDPINMAYLDDLVQVGAYGKDTTAVVRRFIEEGILDALKSGMIGKRDAKAFQPKTRKQSRRQSSKTPVARS
jgi:hypothetical protein